ncbi:hypothetical protein BY458DRAFT_522600 [Sporodiniella umbellata]|nr:hypothetical protein BY458DRAFT_522600 [Sporodiniella umbellata]
MKRIEEETGSLTNKLEKVCFENWESKLQNSANELRSKLQTISDPTDYENYTKILKEQWKDASMFHNKTAIYNEIVDDVLAKICKLPSHKERVEEENRTKTLIMYSFNYFLFEAFDEYAIKNIKDYQQLEARLWKHINDPKDSVGCRSQLDIISLSKNRARRVSKRQRISTENFIDRMEIISQETDDILEPAYNRGMFFVESQLENVYIQLDSIDSQLERHAKAIHFLINPMKEDIVTTKGIQQNKGIQPTTLSYADDDCYLSTALSILVNRYTKQSILKIQEQIDHIQEQLDQLPNKK